MLTLAVDTSSASGSLALLRDREILGQWVSSTDEPYSGRLLRNALELVKAAGIGFEEIDLFAVDAGPGSFTGLRVGLTTVKGWAEILTRPIAAVSGLQAMAFQVVRSPAPAENSFIAAVMDARRGQLFGGLFRTPNNSSGTLEPAGEEMVASAEAFLGSLGPEIGVSRPLVIACVEPELIQPALRGAGLGCYRIEVVSKALAPFIGQLGYAKALHGEVVDALHLDANYIRRSDAELKWKAE